MHKVRLFFRTWALWLDFCGSSCRSLDLLTSTFWLFFSQIFFSGSSKRFLLFFSQIFFSGGTQGSYSSSLRTFFLGAQIGSLSLLGQHSVSVPIWLSSCLPSPFLSKESMSQPTLPPTPTLPNRWTFLIFGSILECGSSWNLSTIHSSPAPGSCVMLGQVWGSGCSSLGWSCSYLLWEKCNIIMHLMHFWVGVHCLPLRESITYSKMSVERESALKQKAGNLEGWWPEFPRKHLQRFCQDMKLLNENGGDLK